MPKDETEATVPTGNADDRKWCGGEWVTRIQENPSLAAQCDWTALNGDDWRRLLKKCPQFADKCDWSLLDGSNWHRLLATQPQFAAFCDWSKLNGEDWKGLLISQPQLAGKCDWDKIDEDLWGRLLEKRPWFRAMWLAVTKQWDQLDDCLAVLNLFRFFPESFPEFLRRYDLSRWSSRTWCFFLTNGGPDVFPLADKCDWSKFDVGTWVWLLAKCPQFADKCDWDLMNAQCTDWTYLLNEQPQFAKYRKSVPPSQG